MHYQSVDFSEAPKFYITAVRITAIQIILHQNPTFPSTRSHETNIPTVGGVHIRVRKNYFGHSHYFYRIIHRKSTVIVSNILSCILGRLYHFKLLKLWNAVDFFIKSLFDPSKTFLRLMVLLITQDITLCSDIFKRWMV